jgi:hypothetical protein
MFSLSILVIIALINIGVGSQHRFRTTNVTPSLTKPPSVLRRFEHHHRPPHLRNVLLLRPINRLVRTLPIGSRLKTPIARLFFAVNLTNPSPQHPPKTPPLRTTPTLALLPRQVRRAHQHVRRSVCDSGVYREFLPRRQLDGCGGYELECGHVWGCVGYCLCGLCVQGEETLCRAGEAFEQDLSGIGRGGVEWDCRI